MASCKLVPVPQSSYTVKVMSVNLTQPSSPDPSLYIKHRTSHNYPQERYIFVRPFEFVAKAFIVIPVFDAIRGGGISQKTSVPLTGQRYRWVGQNALHNWDI